MTIVYLLLIVVSAFIFSWMFSAMLLHAAKRLGWFDVPGERSNHSKPTPKGGGIAVMIAGIGFLMVAGAEAHLVLAALFLAVVSFLDDWRGLSVRARLVCQILAIAYVLPNIPGSVTDGFLPGWLEMGLCALAWLWFVNLYNFMDGIDGITVAQTISLGVGIAALALLPSGVTTGMAADGMVMAAAVLGFAFFNWHPARMFMGDVGSIPLGFIMGYLLLLMASHGALAAALILPAYYVADASYTLLRRLLRGDAVWQSHSQHFYQQAVRSGRAHDAVVREIIALNLVLYVLAGASTLGGVYAVASVALAYALAGMLMFRFRNRPQILEKAAHAH